MPEAGLQRSIRPYRVIEDQRSKDKNDWKITAEFLETIQYLVKDPTKQKHTNTATECSKIYIKIPHSTHAH